MSRRPPRTTTTRSHRPASTGSPRASRGKPPSQPAPPAPPAMKFIIHNSEFIIRIVRRRKHDDRRVTAPYTFLGPATYVTHQGERPMSITWRLHHPMPAELFEEMKVAAE